MTDPPHAAKGSLVTERRCAQEEREQGPSYQSQRTQPPSSYL